MYISIYPPLSSEEIIKIDKFNFIPGAIYKFGFQKYLGLKIGGILNRIFYFKKLK